MAEPHRCMIISHIVSGRVMIHDSANRNVLVLLRQENCLNRMFAQ